MSDALYPNYSIKLSGLKGADALKFFKTDFPSATVSLPTGKAWDGQGKPATYAGGGHQVTWTPISLTRYGDDNTALYDWFKELCDSGSVDGVKQQVMITCMNNDQPLFMWTLEDAVPTGYSQSPADAHSSELLTETVTLTFTSAAKSRG